MLPSHGLLNRKPAARSSKSHTSVACIITTNVALLDPSLSEPAYLAAHALKLASCASTPGLGRPQRGRARSKFWSCVLATLTTRHQRLLTAADGVSGRDRSATAPTWPTMDAGGNFARSPRRTCRIHSDVH